MLKVKYVAVGALLLAYSALCQVVKYDGTIAVESGSGTNTVEFVLGNPTNADAFEVVNILAAKGNSSTGTVEFAVVNFDQPISMGTIGLNTTTSVSNLYPKAAITVGSNTNLYPIYAKRIRVKLVLDAVADKKTLYNYSILFK